ncbi:type I polyketide synthase [Teredinibacter sp. KSP-S5-2]|uniref:type I polyketide synthase n=1 Tax=Teredinibacter sp. KSP-S5-2 TaxID=3034506 RepID=UPI002934A164|nr:beta-ketoacyl synthase N-terminal-like domain-containing protein [Teredinibacter sp. KSP-S5-2]WNO11460.1 beta-ketoacyl synthase N-terminal-like domain-containing protein [Teredinibacter sp. KSP-S5-2]
MNDNDVAIVSVSCRFPDADTPEEFWQNLVDGKCSVRDLDDDYLRNRGVSNEDLSNTDYIKKSIIVDDIDRFDADFFGFTPREAQLLDPQQRIFLEVCWEALERAGTIPSKLDDSIGVFAGASFNTYLINCLQYLKEDRPDLLSKLGGFQSLIHSDKDFIATRTSFKLNLRGPSFTIQSACSTSLLAVHQACQALLNYECDMALAGGASLSVPQNLGYFHQEGMIFSPDGYCRAFDKDAEGTIVGNGVGVVLLKRAVDALDDKDPILAVIKGSAVNNDGSSKVGFTAPSKLGQSEVIEEALGVAEIDPETISYVEAHGTGTTMGDPIEVAALTRAYNTDKKQFCALGSVKTNIGHLDAAAGVAGLIKVALMLQNKKYVPSLHYKAANEKISFKDSPFYVIDNTAPWPEGGSIPRRAAISAFGIGGTNVHLVLEESISQENQHSEKTLEPIFIPVSAKTPASLSGSVRKLKEYLQANSHLSLYDVAHTLHKGRETYPVRNGYVCSSTPEFIELLSSGSAGGYSECTENPYLVMVFSGQGSQYLSMFSGLYNRFSVFQQVFDTCDIYLKQKYQIDIKAIIYSSQEDVELLARTDNAQLALFCVQYSLAKQLQDVGVTPDVVLGHSIGEYAAACLCGVMNLESALDLVFWRGKLMSQMKSGAMLSVVGNPEQFLLPSGVNVSAINGPENFVVSGTGDAISAYMSLLEGQGIECRLLKTSHAYHSPMMNDAARMFSDKCSNIHFSPSSIPFVSSMEGNFVDEKFSFNPEYWANQIVNPVKFNSAIESIIDRYLSNTKKGSKSKLIIMEVGPGKQLTSIINRLAKIQNTVAFSCSRSPKNSVDDDRVFLDALKNLWVNGVDISWEKLSSSVSSYGRRVVLPTYAFERNSYWLGDIEDASPSGKVNEQFDLDNYHFQSAVNSRPNLDVDYISPSSEVEITLAEIWQENLGINKIGIDDIFFELGGDSLQATQVVSAVNGLFSIKIKTADLRAHPTIRTLASVIENRTLDYVSSLSEEETVRLLAEMG